jgi:hypothetical protein
MSSSPALHVVCPCCQAVLSVDPATGAVLSHAAAAPSHKKGMEEALEDVKKSQGRREDLFRQSLSVEKNKSDLLKKKFEEAVRRAKENPDAAPPPREIDL